MCKILEVIILRDFVFYSEKVIILRDFVIYSFIFLRDLIFLDRIRKMMI